ncbi:MAG: hypothetical protein VZR53_07940 [Prevotella sp.]|nr:hypothetical protein [Prevotella sp.]
MPKGFVISHIGIYQSEIFDTYRNPIEVSATINNHWVTFLLRAPRDGHVMSWGAGCDYVEINSEKVKISLKKPAYYSWYGQTIEIGTNILSSMPKEKKGNAFTGCVYSTKPIKDEIKRQLIDLYNKGELNPEFLNRIKPV